MDVFVRDLAPGQNYALQVRAVNDDGASPWSNLFIVNSGTDTNAPAAVVSLAWNPVGTSFHATWTKPNVNVDGSNFEDFRDYVVEISSPNVANTVQTYFTTNPHFTFSYEDNVMVFGTPQAVVQIKVYARDLSYLVGAVATQTATNPAPPAPTDVTTTPGGDSYLVTWTTVAEPGNPNQPLHDLREYEVHHSTTQNFTPSDATRKWRGQANIATVPTSSYATRYVKILSVDVFGTKTASTEASVTPIDPTGTGPDTTPPPTPQDLSVAIAADPGDPLNQTAWAEVTWNTTGVFKDVFEDEYNADPSDTPDLAGYTLKYGPVGGPYQYITTRKPPGGTEVLNSAVIYGLRRGVTYQFRVAAFDVNLNYSAATDWVQAIASADTQAPAAVSGLTLTTSKANFIATWTRNTESDFSHYQYYVTGNGIRVGPFRTTEERFELTLEQNRKWFVTGGVGATKPASVIQFEIKSWDVNNNTQASFVTQTATNNAPGLVANGSWVVNGTSFVGGWDANTDDDFSHYQYYLRASKNGSTYSGTLGPYKTGTNRFTLDLENNRALFSGTAGGATGAYPYVELQVEHVDLLEQTSASRYIQLRQNPVPTAPASITTTAQYDAIVVDWAVSVDDDIVGYQLYVATNSGFTGETLVYSGPSNSFTYQTTQFNTDYWFRVRAIDVFDQLSTFRTVAASTRPRSSYTVDTTVPDVPTGLAATTPTVVNNEIQTTVSWAAVAATDLQGYEVAYSPLVAAQPAQRQWLYEVVGEDVLSTTLRGLEPNKQYAIKIRSFDFSANFSSYSAEITTATTPDAKVNTAMVVESPGIVRSSNYSSGVSGWQLSGSGLEIINGTIKAGALEIQQGANIIPAAYASFEFHPNYYTTMLTGTATWAIGTTAGVAKYGLQYLEANVNGTVYLNNSPAAAAANIQVDANSTYIVSYFARIASGAPIVTPSTLTSSGTTLAHAPYTPTSSMIRQSFTFTTGASDTAFTLFFTGSGSGAYRIDGIQVEKKLAASNIPSQWSPPGVTSVDGGIIRTGEIRSTAVAAVDNTQPAWSLNTQGDMQIGNALVRGEIVVGAGVAADNNYDIRSYGYTAGSQGWAIRGSGAAEFNNVTVRGLITGSSINIGTGNPGEIFRVDTAGNHWAGSTYRLGLGDFPTTTTHDIRRIQTFNTNSSMWQGLSSWDVINSTGGAITSTAVEIIAGWLSHYRVRWTANSTDSGISVWHGNTSAYPTLHIIDVAAEVGQSWSAQIKAKASQAKSARCQVLFYDSAKTLISTVSGSYSALSGSWQTFTVTGSAVPANAKSVNVRINVAAGAGTWLSNETLDVQKPLFETRRQEILPWAAEFNENFEHGEVYKFLVVAKTASGSRPRVVTHQTDSLKEEVFSINWTTPTANGEPLIGYDVYAYVYSTQNSYVVGGKTYWWTKIGNNLPANTTSFRVTDRSLFDGSGDVLVDETTLPRKDTTPAPFGVSNTGSIRLAGATELVGQTYKTAETGKRIVIGDITETYQFAAYTGDSSEISPFYLETGVYEDGYDSNKDYAFAKLHAPVIEKENSVSPTSQVAISFEGTPRNFNNTSSPDPGSRIAITAPVVELTEGTDLYVQDSSYFATTYARKSESLLVHNGTITWTGTALKWTGYFIAASHGQGPTHTTLGYTLINMPIGYIPGVNGHADVTADANGIPMTGVDVLWYEPWLGDTGNDRGSFYISSYTGGAYETIPEHWMMIAARAVNGHVRLGNGEVIDMWRTPTLTNGWVNFGSTFSGARYKRERGFVYLDGLIRSGTVGSAAFTLPAGYRPEIRTLLPTLSDLSPGRVDIYTNGQVVPIAPSTNSWVALSGLVFPAEL